MGPKRSNKVEGRATVARTIAEAAGLMVLLEQEERLSGDVVSNEERRAGRKRALAAVAAALDAARAQVRAQLADMDEGRGIA